MITSIHKIVSSIALAILTSSLSAQVNFEGYITYKGEALIGATVLYGGTTCGTFTNESGNFEISCDKEGSNPPKIIIAYTGFKRLELEFDSIEDLTGYTLFIHYKSKRKYLVDRVKKE